MFQTSRPRPTDRIDPESIQRSGRALPRAEAAAHAASGGRIGTRLKIGLLALLVACAGLPLAAGAADNSCEGLQAQGPGTVFASVEAAALDALSYAHLTATLTDRRRLRVGVIHRAESGFSYTAAKRSATLSPLMAHSVHYQLYAIDVARYVIPPRSKQLHMDRLNEEPTGKEKQIVDELDPEHRPLYQLTPSLNVVIYRQGGPTSVVVNLKDLAASKDDAAASGAEHALATPAAPRPIQSTTLFARSASVTAPD